MTLDVHIHQGFEGFTLDAGFVAERGITALFGRSGAGKTSVINAVAGLLRPEAGHVRMDGETLFDCGAGIWVPPAARRFGYVFQDARLFPHLDVLQNLRFGTRYAPAGAKGASEEDVIALLGLADLLTRAPGGLSGGEKQRAAIARAVIGKPELLLADEPTGNVDPQMARRLLRLFIELNRLGTSVVIATHDHQLMRQFKAPRLELHDGHVRIV